VSRAGDVGLDVLADGARGGSEFGSGLGLAGGQQRAEQAVAQFGLQDRDLDSAGSQIERKAAR